MEKPNKRNTGIPKYADEGRRLRAARLAAGYIFVIDAAMVLALSVVTYRSIEAGSHKPSKKVNGDAAAAFDVSFMFLDSGVAGDGRNDTLAVDLLAVLDSIDETDARRGERLRDMRIDAGFETGSAAARHHEWKTATYLGHESGVYPIPVDRIIGYALALGFVPEAASASHPLTKRPTNIVWHERPRVTPVPIEPTYIPWAWSRDLRRKPGRKIVLVSLQKGQLALSDYPDILLSDEEAPPKTVKVFGLASSAEEGVRVTLVAARPPESGEVGLAVLDGAVVEYGDVPKKIEDPLRARAEPGVPVPLGTRLDVVTMPTVLIDDY